MEIILLIIYSVVVWFIFFKKKWLPWNLTTQVIAVTIPIGMRASPHSVGSHRSNATGKTKSSKMKRPMTR